MIKLKQLLREIQEKPKAIIMAGGAAVGKTTLLNKIGDALSGYEIINADKYVEDKASPMYNNLAAAASQIKKQDLPNAISAKKNFVYDTTAGSIKPVVELKGQLDANGYDTMMIMVYAHPAVSFLRNFSRERKLPVGGVLTTWINVYSLIDDYKRMFGKNFVAVQSSDLSPEEQKEVENFDAAVKNGTLKEYIQELKDRIGAKSTFNKTKVEDLTPEELEKKKKEWQKAKEKMDQSIEKIESMFSQIQSTLIPDNISTGAAKVKQFSLV